jgi:hypothetical protein
VTSARRPALLDVNVLVALFDPDHVHHEVAHDWFEGSEAEGWATCGATECGFVRVVSNPAYRAAVARPADLIERLRTFCASPYHVFWADTVSLTASGLFKADAIGSHRHLTDIYLLGLAQRMGGRLATFDRTIPLSAVKGATRDTVAVIEPTS